MEGDYFLIYQNMFCVTSVSGSLNTTECLMSMMTLRTKDGPTAIYRLQFTIPISSQRYMCTMVQWTAEYGLMLVKNSEPNKRDTTDKSKHLN